MIPSYITVWSLFTCAAAYCSHNLCSVVLGNSPEYAAGQQCCYDSTGAQILTGDSIGGSTPDRAHDWGSPPFRKPPRIPGQSHWVYDVLSFYYCCLWSDNCHYYFKHRPSSDCRSYQPPRSGESTAASWIWKAIEFLRISNLILVFLPLTFIPQIFCCLFVLSTNATSKFSLK